MKSSRHPLLRAACAAGVVLAPVGAAWAEETIVSVSIKNHRFEPAEARVPAGTPITLVVKNLDATPEEFESKQLRLEKVITGNGSATFRLHPLSPGRYRFFGEFHEDSAQGDLLVE